MRQPQDAIVILASGLSKRFGRENKLLASFRGRPLADYSAQAALSFGKRKIVAIVPDADVALAKVFAKPGIEIINNNAPELGMGCSLRLGVKACQHVDRIFVLLADMPLVSKAHLAALSDRLGEAQAAFAFDGVHHSPPAIFARSVFPMLLNLSGDIGARAIINDLERVVSVDFDADSLADVDRPADIDP